MVADRLLSLKGHSREQIAEMERLSGGARPKR